jgi:hypothetical protein
MEVLDAPAPAQEEVAAEPEPPAQEEAAPPAEETEEEKQEKMKQAVADLLAKKTAELEVAYYRLRECSASSLLCALGLLFCALLVFSFVLHLAAREN